MLSKKMTDALNKQINEELHSAYIYAAMSSYFEHTNLRGFAHWMRLQNDEELAHARRIVDYMHSRGAKVALTEIAAPPNAWKDPLDAFEAAYKHECHISACINDLATLAVQEKDHATHNFLEWFVGEQVEEEANADQVVQQLKLIKDAPAALFMLDREMAGRQPEPEAG